MFSEVVTSFCLEYLTFNYVYYSDIDHSHLRYENAEEAGIGFCSGKDFSVDIDYIELYGIFYPKFIIIFYGTRSVKIFS